MVSELLQTASFVSDLLGKRADRKAKSNLLYRSLRIEVATNLNLIRSIHDRMKNSQVRPGREAMQWLTRSLSIDTVRAVLIADPKYFSQLSDRVYQEDTPDAADTMIPNLEAIAIKVTEMTAVACAPDDEVIPSFNWNQRLANLRELHLAVLSMIKVSA